MESGYAPAADANGDVYFSTGNSDPGKPTYSQSFNRPDSIVRLSADLNSLVDSFTPANYFQLDQADLDEDESNAQAGKVTQRQPVIPQGFPQLALGE